MFQNVSRSTTAPEVQRELSESTFVPAARTIARCPVRFANVVGSIGHRCTLAETFNEDEPLVHFLAACLVKKAIKIVDR
jgi:hypothetical protein